MTKIKLYITRRIPQPGIDLLSSKCDIEFWDSDEAITKEELLKHVPGVGALLCMLTDKIDDEILAAAGNIIFQIYSQSQSKQKWNVFWGHKKK